MAGGESDQPDGGSASADPRGPGGSPAGWQRRAVSADRPLPDGCELLRDDPPARLQGRRAGGRTIKGAGRAVREEVAEGTYHAGDEPQRRSHRAWKYSPPFDARETRSAASIDDGPAKDLWMRHGWAERPRWRGSAATTSCSTRGDAETGSKRRAGRSGGGASERREWMGVTADPLLDGPVPPPPGAEYNEQDQTSARERTRGLRARAHRTATYRFERGMLAGLDEPVARYLPTPSPRPRRSRRGEAADDRAHQGPAVAALHRGPGVRRPVVHLARARGRGRSRRWW